MELPLPDDTANEIGATAALLNRAYFRRLGEELGKLGIAPGQYPVLLQLWEQDGLNQKTLVERLGVEQATMANTLMRMERDGLVERAMNPQDRRSANIRLSAKARSLERAARAAVAVVDSQAGKGLYSSEQERLVTLMRKVTANLGG